MTKKRVPADPKHLPEPVGILQPHAAKLYTLQEKSSLAFLPDGVYRLAARGFLTYGHLDRLQMRGRFFSNYNRRCPSRAMEAPKGVGYVLAVL